ncbi:hypothetical protein BOTCAL_0337g00160 [Botryotinia calthae]|uniref:Uncharacterized protein n=1 Tax=Botryotinia calthae TaxID=38488 RepID=A0A4Y8CTQ8_9HELO|nr:hypothetical protein BOTCAL_0337g00160 [Botryotinia calthae]
MDIRLPTRATYPLIGEEIGRPDAKERSSGTTNKLPSEQHERLATRKVIVALEPDLNICQAMPEDARIGQIKAVNHRMRHEA